MSTIRGVSRFYVTGFVLALTACGTELPSGPSPESRWRAQLSYVIVRCTPIDTSLSCRVNHAALGDVTAESEWQVSDSTIATIASDGVLTPLRRGEIDVTGVHVSSYGRLSAKESYLVDPRERPRKLSFLGGNVLSNDPGGERVAGALVEILDGYSRGKSATSNNSGWYSIEPVLTDETFTVRASKEGYEPQTQTYRLESSAFLDFRLTRIASP